MCKPLLSFGNSSCIGGCFGNAHVFCFCCSVNALCVLRLIYCCSSRYYIIIMATGKHESDKQNFKLCVPPCPRFITGGDRHSLCVACLVVEHARSALEGADCPYCVRLSMRTFRSRRALFEGALSPVFPAVRVPLLQRQGGALNLGDHKWIWQKVWRWARPFLLLPLPGLALTLWGWRHLLRRFSSQKDLHTLQSCLDRGISHIRPASSVLMCQIIIMC